LDLVVISICSSCRHDRNSRGTWCCRQGTWLG
jgi:hypothetical protein